MSKQRVFDQATMPESAEVGDVWTDQVNFKRVFSRGGAWENVNLGSRHPDEPVEETTDERSTGAEAGGSGTDVPEQPDSAAQGAGDDGQASEPASGEEPESVTEAEAKPSRRRHR